MSTIHALPSLYPQTLKVLHNHMLIHPHLKSCLATATHNLKWVKTIHICLIGDEKYANSDV